MPLMTTKVTMTLDSNLEHTAVRQACIVSGLWARAKEDETITLKDMRTTARKKAEQEALTDDLVTGLDAH